MAVDRLFVGFDAGPKIEEVSPTDLSGVWSQSIAQEPEAGSINGASAFFYGGDNGKLGRLELDGTLTYEVDVITDGDVNYLHHDGGYVFCVGEFGELRKFDATDGSEVTSNNWPATLDAEAEGVHSHDGSVVYVGGLDGALYEFDYSTGARNAKFTPNANVANLMEVHRDGDVIIAVANTRSSQGGTESAETVYRINTALDTVLWSDDTPGTEIVWNVRVLSGASEIVVAGDGWFGVYDLSGSLLRHSDGTGTQPNIDRIRDFIVDVENDKIFAGQEDRGSFNGIVEYDLQTLDENQNRSATKKTVALAATFATSSTNLVIEIQFDDTSLNESGVEYQVWGSPDPQLSSVVDEGTGASISNGVLSIDVDDAQVADGDSVYVLAYVTDGEARRGWSGDATVKTA